MSDNPIRYFKIEFFPEVKKFLKTVDKKAVAKIFWNLDLAERTNDPKLFKKLTDDVGNSGRFIKVCNIACLHFGTKQIRHKH